jgi:hypothetical protein
MTDDFEKTFLEDPTPPPATLAPALDTFKRRAGGDRTSQDDEIERYLAEAVQPYERW